MRKSKKTRDQLLRELRNAYEGGASIRNLAATTGRSYGSIHSMLRESGTTMRGRGGPIAVPGRVDPPIVNLTTRQRRVASSDSQSAHVKTDAPSSPPGRGRRLAAAGLRRRPAGPAIRRAPGQVAPQNVARHIVTHSVSLLLPAQPIGGRRRQFRGALRPAAAEVRVVAQLACDLQPGGQPVELVGRGKHVAHHTDEAFAGCYSRHSLGILARQREKARPCRGSGERSHRATSRLPVPGAGPWPCHSRIRQSNGAHRRGSDGGEPPDGPR